ncbi:MAG: hypothetical protein KDC54_09855, partial [Lewinella sp.]|nr:hypothetical protein [Lewinella sp.]
MRAYLLLASLAVSWLSLELFGFDHLVVPPDPEATHYCAADALHGARLASDPGYRNSSLLLERLYREQQPISGRPRLNPPYLLPIVFHLVHQNGPENISDAQLATALDQLNAAFANMGYYDQGTGVMTDIQFCLARRNPDGNASSGVERVVSSLTELTLETEDAALKNLSRYDPTRYINVWVVDEICSSAAGCGVAGYAYFPSAHGSDIDGIVVEARWLGTSEGNTGVLIHEMGHYLGLYHTFEGACQNDDCLADGDRVCDTPPDASTAAVPCNASPNSCTTDPNSGFATDQPDMFYNYMDYGDWDCYSAFTAGQRDRMHFFIENARSSLLQSQGCIDPCNNPVTLTASVSPGDTVDAGVPVNFSATATNATNLTWTVDGNPAGVGTSFQQTFTSPGQYAVRVRATGGDPNCFADTTIQMVVRCPVDAVFSPSSYEVPPFTVVYFTNQSAGADTYSWSIDGVPQSSGTSFFYEFTSPGAYTVTLLAGSDICTDQYAVVITVGQGSAATGLPIWPMRDGATGILYTIDWRSATPTVESLSSFGALGGGMTGVAFTPCGDVAFHAVHTGSSDPNQLHLYDAEGSPLLTNATANGPGLNGVRAGTEIQVVPVPSTIDEWYVIYREWGSDVGAELGNAGYRALPLLYSRVRLEAVGQLTVVERDIALPAGGSVQTYSDGMAVSRTVQGDPTRHYLYAARRTVNQASLSVDRFIISAAGITWDANTGTVPANYW